MAFQPTGGAASLSLPSCAAPQASASIPRPAVASGPGVPSTTLAVATDPQSYATSSHSGAQQLVHALTREHLITDSPQLVARTTIDREGFATTDKQWLNLGKTGQLSEWNAGQKRWQASGAAVLYCDELGVVRDASGGELGRLGIDQKLAGQLQAAKRSDGSSQGAFLAFNDHLESCTFYPRTAQGYGAPQLFNPADRRLGAGSAVIAIGRPPSVNAEHLEYAKAPQQAIVDHIGRDGAGGGGQLPIRRLEPERHFDVGVSPHTTEERMTALSSGLTRTLDEMRATADVTDRAGTVTRRGEQRWEFLQTRDQRNGAASRQAFGLNDAGDLMCYVGNAGTAEERTKANGWRTAERAGVEHLFIREDFTVVDKRGEVVGSLNPLDLKAEDVRLAKGRDGSTHGLFLQREASIVLSNGATVRYRPDGLALGDKTAVLQFGTPPGARHLPLREPLDPQTFVALMGIAGDGGLVVDDKRPNLDAKPGVRHYLSQGGAMRITVDESRVNRDRLVQIDKALDALLEIKRRGGGLTAEQKGFAKQLGTLLQNELAQYEVRVERRMHLFSRGWDASGQPDRLAVWREEPGVKLSFNELTAHFPEIGSPGAPRREPTKPSGGSSRSVALAGELSRG